MKKSVSSLPSVALVGVGGYGGSYVGSLLKAHSAKTLHFIGGVDPFIASIPAAATLAEAGVPTFPTTAELYAATKPDLVILASPIQYHCAQVVEALQHGAHVLCEKPLAATVEQCHTMRAARDKARKVVAVGFQWSFSTAIQSLKRDIMAGVLGKPLAFRTVILWPRDSRYYGRNQWAGRELGEGSLPVFDSPANNAAAHFLHNMLFVLGSTMNRSAEIDTVTAELYRANTIDSYDTSAIRVITTSGTPLLFITSHAIPENRGPYFQYEFENAIVSYGNQSTADDDDRDIVARFHSGPHAGTIRRYGSPDDAGTPGKINATLHSIATGQDIICGIETATPHAQAIEAARKSSDIHPFPASLIRDTPVSPPAGNATLRYIEGLEQILLLAYESGKLPSELGHDWARAGKPIKVAHPPKRTAASAHH